MKDNTLAARQRDNQQLRQELHTKEESLVVAGQRELAARQRENQQLRQELHTKEESLVAGQRELAARQRENQHFYTIPPYRK